jgi:hypothetical protein
LKSPDLRALAAALNVVHDNATVKRVERRPYAA